MGTQTIALGIEIFIPCQVTAIVPDPTPLQTDDAGMVLLTGSNYPPFTTKT